MPESLEEPTDHPESEAKRNVHEFAGFDVFSDVLSGLGLRSRLFCQTRLTAPWGMSFGASDLAHFHWFERGSGWLDCPGKLTRPVALTGGDLVLLPGGHPYSLRSEPDAPVVPLNEVLGGPGSGRCRLLEHGGGGPQTRMLCGSFSFEREGSPLLSLLPPVVHVSGEDEAARANLEPLMRALAAEPAGGQPGWETVMNRLMDVVFVQVIRVWLREQPADSHWLTALNDRQIHRALSLMHERPHHPWSLQELGRESGLSRSPFAARFTRLVGEPPLSYLTRLRMQRAARALRERRVPLADAAQIAGYTSEIAFGKAFKRVMGVSPGAYRESD